ncbi:MAG: hypothetical protein ACR2GA_00655 [Chloroflexota bacterium]
MSTGGIIAIIVIVVIILLILAAFGVMQSRKRQQTSNLQQQFGPEYDRAVEKTGDPKAAQQELEARRDHVQELSLQPLSLDQRNQYSEEWRSTQAQFVDDPGGAVKHADELITQVMQTRGYPANAFDERASDVSVVYPNDVENYRVAHGIAQRDANGQANTEDLRDAMVRYRSLFEQLLKT